MQMIRLAATSPRVRCVCVCAEKNSTTGSPQRTPSGAVGEEKRKQGPVRREEEGETKGLVGQAWAGAGIRVVSDCFRRPAHFNFPSSGDARGRQQSPEGVGSGVERSRLAPAAAAAPRLFFPAMLSSRRLLVLLPRRCSRKCGLITISPRWASACAAPIVGNRRRRPRWHVPCCSAVRPFFRIFCPDAQGGPRTTLSLDAS